QGGMARVGGVARASLWAGTAASWVDLSPPGATFSAVLGMYPGRQAGWAQLGGVSHAGMWTGTAASWVDLHVPGSIGSMVRDLDNLQLVGNYADANFIGHAALWEGDPI